MGAKEHTLLPRQEKNFVVLSECYFEGIIEGPVSLCCAKSISPLDLRNAPVYGGELQNCGDWGAHRVEKNTILGNILLIETLSESSDILDGSR